MSQNWKEKCIWYQRNEPIIVDKLIIVGRDSVVCIATRYTDWTVRELNPGRGEIFRSPPDRLWGLPTIL